MDDISKVKDIIRDKPLRNSNIERSRERGTSGDIQRKHWIVGLWQSREVCSKEQGVGRGRKLSYMDFPKSAVHPDTMEAIGEII